MNILVTGAAGFIGSHLCQRLLSEDHYVVGLDNFDPYYALQIKRGNLVRLTHPNFAFHQADICDRAALQDIFAAQSFDRVVHLAARAGVRPSIEEPSLYCDVNLTGTTNIFECARKSDTPVVFASSSSVYGGSTCVPYREDDPCLGPISPYAATKRAGELMAFTFGHLFQLPIVALRFFTVYGPRQRPDMAIALFTERVLDGKPITLFGDGTSARDYTFVRDIVSGVVSATERTPQLGGEIINLGNSQTVELRRLIEVIEDATGKTAHIEWQADQPGDVPLTFADISRAQKLLDYAPQTKIEDGVREVVRWMREENA
jgi:UDP-glucuronate 4-epimerase